MTSFNSFFGAENMFLWCRLVVSTPSECGNQKLSARPQTISWSGMRTDMWMDINLFGRFPITAEWWIIVCGWGLLRIHEPDYQTLTKDKKVPATQLGQRPRRGANFFIRSKSELVRKLIYLNFAKCHQRFYSHNLWSIDCGWALRRSRAHCFSHGMLWWSEEREKVDEFWKFISFIYVIYDP